MKILELIQEANTRADIRTFSFANIAEFNSFMKSFTELDYPANVVEPFQTNLTWLNGRTKTVVNINGWVLKRIDTNTFNFRTAQVEELHLEPMRAKAKLFLKYLMSSESAEDIIDPEVDGITSTIKPEYAFLPSRLFGVSYTIQLPVIEKIC